MTTTQTVQPLTFKELAAVAWRRRWPALICAAAAIVLVLAATSRITPMYEARARLAVDRGHQPVPFQIEGQTGNIEMGLLNTQRELLLSTPVLDRAWRDSTLKDNPAYGTARDPAGLLRKRLKVTTSRDSWVIGVELRDEDPDRAAAGLDAVVRAYLEYQAERQSGRSTGAVTFLRDQVEVARGALEASRAREEAFRLENGIQSTDPERNHIAQRLQAMTTARIALERDRAATAAVADQVRVASAVADGSARRGALMRIDEIGRHPAVVELQARVAEAEAEAARLTARGFLEKHPRTIEAQGRLVEQHRQLDAAIGAAAAALETRGTTFTAQAEEMSRQITVDNEALAAYRERLIDLAAISEESRTRQGLFEGLLRKLGEEEVASRLAMSRVTLIDPAKAGAMPVNIRRTVFLALALAAATLAGATAALAMEAFDRRVRGVDNAAELTGLPILGAVPRAADIVPLGRNGDPEKPHLVAEACRALRAALLLTQRREGSRCIAITSTAAGEGKSTLSARLAVSLASTGARVLLVDADMRKPTLHHQLGEGGERGLSFLLAGYDGIAPAPTSYANLDFLGVGVRPPNPAELLHSPAFAQLLARARGQYQFILVDTPPLGAVADALVVAEHVDGVMLVVRDRTTSKSALAHAMRKLAPVADKLLGFVLNDERKGRGAAGYYYSYQYALPGETTPANG